VNGLKKLVLPYSTEGLSMETRGTIFYAFTKSQEHSVFSSETHLTWHLLLLQQNSQEWWKVQSARIRISISLDTPLSWVDADFLHQKIGTTLSLTRNHNKNQWCDYCKYRYGVPQKFVIVNDAGEKAEVPRPAVWKVQSETPLRKAQVRFYCQPCADEAQNWPDGTFYLLKEQLEDAINDFAGREKLDVELP
jgi:hypothetical protein